jgi:hypothetical protein
MPLITENFLELLNLAPNMQVTHAGKSKKSVCLYCNYVAVFPLKSEPNFAAQHW